MQGRDGPGAFRGYGAVSVQGIVYINDAPFAVSSYRNASAEMNDYQVQLVVGFAHDSGMAFGDGFLVKRMQDGQTLYLRDAGNPGYILQFIHYNGIGDERFASGNRLGNTVCQQSAQVGCVFSRTAVGKVLEHQLIHAVSARWDGPDHTAPADDCRKACRVDFIVLQLGKDGFFPEFKLLAYVGKRCQVFCSVQDGFAKNFLAAFVDRDFGGCGAGIDDQNVFFHNLCI